MTNPPLPRCPWPSEDPLMIQYHDEEWGVPLHDDRKLFEYIVLDAFQAGLSWRTVLHKRENFRKALDGFDFVKIAAYDQAKIDQLILDAGIIRNKAKIYATVQNAKCFMEIQQEFGSFDSYIWSFTGGKTLVNHWKSLSELPAKSDISDRMSKDLMKRGFKFVGSTICYAFMQAAGMVNDHLVTCFLYSGSKG
jgi:DNA-3-methyladenine glycosylase I